MELSAEQKIEMQRRMLRIRLFDERAVTLKARGVIPGALHTSIGHEAAIVGACSAVREDDYMTGFHRSHGHPIAKGAKLPALMAELFGRSTGICRGKGGSMHLADFAVGSIGESGIVGAGLPIAVGAGLSSQLQGTDRVCLCFFGDGAANGGAFHEALNLAAIWHLPVIFVCENNRYAITVPSSYAMAVSDVATRATSYGMPGVVTDGQDVLAVHEAAAAAVARARAGDGPSLIEAKTYRFREHEELGFKLHYRTQEEIDEWRRRDPVSLFAEELIRQELLDAAGLEQLREEIRAEIDEAVEFAQASPLPAPDDALEHVFATPLPRVRPAFTPPRDTKQLSYLDAHAEAIAQEMRRDPAVFYMGEDIRAGVYGKFPIDEFPQERVRDTPISENGFAGCGVGAAMTGMRPVVMMSFSTFLYLAMDQVVNQAAKLHYMSGGQARVPVTYLATCFYRGGIAAHHSDRPLALFANCPGLKIAVPSNAHDMKGLLASAIRDDDPVIVFGDSSLWPVRDEVGVGDYTIPFGLADVKRPGSDVTVVAALGMVGLALAAAARLEEDEGISAEVIDPRTLVPFDQETLLASVAKTGRLVVVDPGPRNNGIAAEIIARVAESCDLLAHPIRVAGADTPTPFSPPMERFVIPDQERIEDAVRRVVAGRRPAHHATV
ncbi:MAG TPA: thiamine pyrophosphate-dependent enzyme [Acidimicrobiales bacterium]|nr:thiamine pyrophosphate-dependent enzyme [Acidimicrobiales bacterium]